MTDPIIRLAGVGKRYLKYEDEPMLLTRALRLRHRTRRSQLWAVRDVSFELHPGDSVGVIGRNGSGKSTLLQMLAGVTSPTEGTVTVGGRVAPLVSVGVGFHPELTGRENVYVNGTILGLSRAEIDARFDAMVEFSGIEAFIDTPVKFYSSGMYVRLGFAVAVEAIPDVLLVDEVLAVGDVSFQLKCFRRMAEIRRRGTTVVVVTHNLNALRQLVDRAMVLHDGRLRHDGEVDEAIGVYHELIGEHADPDSGDVGVGVGRAVETGVATVEQMTLRAANGAATTHISGGDLVTVEVDVAFDQTVERPLLGMSVTAANGANVYSETSAKRPLRPAAAGDRRRYSATLRLPLTTGSYSLHASIHRVEDEHFAMTQLHAAKPVPFFVSSRTGVGGFVDLDATFTEAD